MKKCLQLFSLILLVAMVSPALAKTEYVSDQLEIDLYQQPSINSTVTGKLSIGDSVEVLQEQGEFKRITLDNGDQGWVRAQYLGEEPPQTAQDDQLASKNEQLSRQLEERNQQLKKVQSDLQARRDELSNARTTIDKLEKQIEAGAEGKVSREAQQQKLAEKDRRIEQLQSEIDNLKEKLATKQVASQEPGMELSEVEQYREQLERQSKRNEDLQARIDLAREFLTREELPSAEEIEKWRPSLPGWYWGTLLMVLIIGIVGGIGWMDYRLRRRHGGFRV
ncbi:TIGR04211 family SH3 domain-containing protein [Thiohalophilus thiocyanatoxydans]|uniref:SH3 domain protein n=1 Tax=Thiohalophilus thiocyanatoxydans TaxID=381308 RepID=A0A4R8IWM3_9GAMM|nr:TIGR04211 family SH3 domain-containing protein [Thiohalophilus thiocyanatoxydans]TDY03900.1 SH3 domain protein [Thiohalophilus thiocyanatoxydans]